MTSSAVLSRSFYYKVKIRVKIPRKIVLALAVYTRLTIQKGEKKKVALSGNIVVVHSVSIINQNPLSGPHERPRNGPSKAEAVGPCARIVCCAWEYYEEYYIKTYITWCTTSKCTRHLCDIPIARYNICAMQVG